MNQFITYTYEIKKSKFIAYIIKPNTKVNVMIRPEDFDIVPKKKSYLTVKVKEVIYKGLL